MDASTPFKSLTLAAHAGDADAFEAAIAAGADVNAEVPVSGGSYLSVLSLIVHASAGPQAPLAGRARCARAALAAGAHCEGLPNETVGPLSMACWTGNVDAARLLIQAGADLERAGPDGQRPFMRAVVSGWNDCAALLLAAGADPDAEDERGLSAASWARQHGRSETRAMIDLARARREAKLIDEAARAPRSSDRRPQL